MMTHYEMIGWGVFFIALNITNILLITAVADGWGC